MKGDFLPHSLFLVMIVSRAEPHTCPLNCKVCSEKLTTCELVSSLDPVLDGLSNSTLAIFLLNGDLSVIPPTSFQKFHKLQWLYINGCLVSSLLNMTFVTGEGNSLQELDLNNNRLQSCLVDISAFAGMDKLEKLILTNNALDVLKKSWFMDLKLLIRLSVSANIISYVPPRTFESLEQLNFLDLADNQIEYLYNGAFYGLNSLTELNVSRNHIVFIEEHTFRSLKGLRILHLSGNNLVTLPSFPELVKYLYLHDNPWKCSCQLVDQVKSLKEKVVDSSLLLCDMPEDLKGQQVVTVGPDVCTNATEPGEALTPERPRSFDPLYSFIGGLFCASVIFLFVTFYTKWNRQNRTTNPTGQKGDEECISPKEKIEQPSISLGIKPELPQCHLTSESTQPLTSNQEMLDSAQGTSIIGLSEASAKTDGLSKCLTAPDLLYSSRESNKDVPTIPKDLTLDSKQSMEPLSYDTKSCWAQDMLNIQDQHLKLHIEQNGQPLPETAHHGNPKPRTEDPRSTHDHLKCCSAPDLHLTPREMTNNPLLGLHPTSKASQCCTTGGTHPDSDHQTFSNTQDIFPITADADILRMMDNPKTSQDHQHAAMLSRIEDVGCLQSAGLLPKDVLYRTEQPLCTPEEYYYSKIASNTSDAKDLESGVLQYYEMQHVAKGMESVTDSKYRLHSHDLESPIEPMAKALQTNTNNEKGQKNLSIKCKTWSTFSKTMQEYSVHFEDNLKRPQQTEDLIKRTDEDNLQSDGQSSKLSGSLSNTTSTEQSDSLRNCSTTEPTDTMRSGQSGELQDSQQKGRSTMPQGELVRFFGSGESLSSESCPSDDEQETADHEVPEGNLSRKHLPQSRAAALRKAKGTTDGLLVTQTGSTRSLVKAKSANQYIGRTMPHDHHLSHKSYLDRDGHRERRITKRHSGSSSPNEALFRKRFWKYHTNCCDEYKPCPTAKKVLRPRKAASLESPYRESYRMTKEMFWSYHSRCCDETMPCHIAKKVMARLMHTSLEPSSSIKARLAREQFWKYHRYCCNEYRPCPKAKKVMEHLKITPLSGQVDAEPLRSPPTDEDLLEDQHTFPPLPPKKVNGQESYAEHETKWQKRKNLFILPNLQIRPSDAALCRAENKTSPRKGDIPLFISVKPAPSASSTKKLRSELSCSDKAKAQPTDETQDMSLEQPGNREYVSMDHPGKCQTIDSNWISRQFAALRLPSKTQRAFAKAASYLPAPDPDSRTHYLDPVENRIKPHISSTVLTSRYHLPRRRRAFLDSDSCTNLNILPYAIGTLNQGTRKVSSKGEGKSSKAHASKTPASLDVSSDDEFLGN